MISLDLELEPYKFVWIRIGIDIRNAEDPYPLTKKGRIWFRFKWYGYLNTNRIRNDQNTEKGK